LGFYFWDNHLRWYIKGESENSLAVHFWAHGFVYFSVSYGFKSSKINDFDKSKLDVIKSCYDRIDENKPNSLGVEYGNFSFGSVYDGRFPNCVLLAWYAGNRTEELADQIIAKVRKFQTPEITALFKEINEKCC